MPATKEQIRQIIADNNLNSVADVYTLLNDIVAELLRSGSLDCSRTGGKLLEF